MRISRPIQNLVESFERLPGIGPKTAQRLTFYLLHVPLAELDQFAENLMKLKRETKVCRVCFNVSEIDPCPICQDLTRDESIICVIETPLDLIAIEKTGKFRGVYHTLGGLIDPLNNFGPDEIRIGELIKRIKNNEVKIKEIILALNPTMEGEATSMYIAREIKNNNFKLSVTRIARGLPTGSDLEYADEVTLQRAMEGRREF